MDSIEEVYGKSNLDYDNEIVFIPEGVKRIKECAFINCRYIKEIVIPSSVEHIGKLAFFGCFDLEKITIPSSIKEIPFSAFSQCYNLKEVVFPNSVSSIGDCVFFKCKSLEKVVLSRGIKKIPSSAFCYCSNLKEIKVPKSVVSIGERAFQSCVGLKEMILPKGVKRIERSAFKDCKNLKRIVLPETLETLEELVFEYCDSLEKIVLPESLKNIDPSSFWWCKSLKELRVNNYNNVSTMGLSIVIDKLRICYHNESTGELMFLLEDRDVEDGFKRVGYNEMLDYFDCSVEEAILLSLCFDLDDVKALGPLGCMLVNIANEFVNKNNCRNFKKELKSKEFIHLLNKLYSINSFVESPQEYYDLFKFAYSIGAFSENQIDRQKACEFISYAFEKEAFEFNYIHGIFESFTPRTFTKEWAEFIMDKKNFKELIELEKKGEGLISQIGNSFEDIREYGTSNRGSQEYKKVTIQMCKEYLRKIKFKGVNEDNIDISEMIGKYSVNQESFDEAVDIRNKYIGLKKSGMVDDHILGEELFEEIDEERKEILESVEECLEDLADVIDNKFTYEFLSKYDALNFVLGKYCSCCSHIEGAGKGIMKATIIHPDCQNLVIRNERGRVIAKSTLYINRKEGYGVFNNVEINNYIRDDETKILIYKKYLEAVDAFARKYNNKHPNNPLRQINVGMSLNDLNEQLGENNEKASELLQGLDFSLFGGYSGDWQNGQYVIWRNTEDRGGRK